MTRKEDRLKWNHVSGPHPRLYDCLCEAVYKDIHQADIITLIHEGAILHLSHGYSFHFTRFDTRNGDDVISFVIRYRDSTLGAIRFIGQFLGLSADAAKLIIHMKITDIELESVKISPLAIPGLSQT